MNRRKRSLPGKRKEIEITETRPRIGIRRDENGFLESNMCHQCQRNDKEGVVRCTKCKAKRYCYQCMLSWYPEMSAEAIAEACPVCRIKCNCKPCLRMEVSNQAREEIRMKSMIMIGNEQKIQYSKYMIKALLPFLQQINKEQVIERELEAKIQGVSVSDIQIDKAEVDIDESIYCDNCRTSIADYHRSCPLCSYELCLDCCRELRDGHLQGLEKGPPFNYFDYGVEYLHGGKRRIHKRKSKNIDSEILTKEKKLKNNLPSPSHWKANENVVISCPKKDKGGCGEETLILKCLLPDEFVSKLLMEAKNMFDAHKMDFAPECLEKSCFCYNFLDGDDVSSKRIRIAASREESSDNKLYQPSAVEIEHGDLQHFQSHWSKCEPVIVSNVLETTVGLSWEPMVMYRAFRQPKSQGLDGLLDVSVTNCLDWCEMPVNLHQFFKGYLDAYTYTQFDAKGWPQMLKLEDWPPCSLFGKLLPRHSVEFISCLPFKEYTHPEDGYLNLATKLNPGSLKPDVGPKTSVAYGFCEELGRGDSVTKLRCNMADAVHVLMHLNEVSISPEHVKIIKEVKAKHAAQDQIEISGAAGDKSKALKEPELANMNKAGVKDDKEKIPVSKALNDDQKCKGPREVRHVHMDANDQIQLLGGKENVGPSRCSLYDAEGGALWDIFRQQDVPKLEEYIRRHFNEFRHFYANLLPQATHPIHDGTIYLTIEHKKQLKEEYGIEPWTFVQKLGDAVFIPAGCPHQVRNLKSCIKVALEFVSPESVSSCLRLTKELRLLPLNHRFKEDKLEVKKMIIHAMRRAVDDLSGVISSQPRQPMKRFKSGRNLKRRNL